MNSPLITVTFLRAARPLAGGRQFVRLANDAARILRSWFWQALHELKQAFLQAISAGLGEFDEAEGLQPALRGPHGEHHLDAFADGVLAEVEDQLDFEFFVEGILHVHQAAGDGELVQFAAHFAPIGQAYQSEDGAAKLDAKRALLATAESACRLSLRGRGWGRRHREASMAARRTGHEVTKEQWQWLLFALGLALAGEHVVGPGGLVVYPAADRSTRSGVGG